MDIPTDSDIAKLERAVELADRLASTLERIEFPSEDDVEMIECATKAAGRLQQAEQHTVEG